MVMRGCVCTYITILLTTPVYISLSYTTHCMITFDHVTWLASKQRLNKFPNIRIHNFNKIRRHWGRNFEVSAAGTTLYRLVAPYKVLKVWNSFMISNRCRYFFVNSWLFFGPETTVSWQQCQVEGCGHTHQHIHISTPCFVFINVHLF